VSLLLRPAPDRDSLVGEVPVPELLPAEDGHGYSDEQWRRADDLLDLPDVARRLSGLLAVVEWLRSRVLLRIGDATPRDGQDAQQQEEETDLGHERLAAIG
jgi:hypothetical protein